MIGKFSDSFELSLNKCVGGGRKELGGHLRN